MDGQTARGRRDGALPEGRTPSRSRTRAGSGLVGGLRLFGGGVVTRLLLVGDRFVSLLGALDQVAGRGLDSAARRRRAAGAAAVAPAAAGVDVLAVTGSVTSSISAIGALSPFRGLTFVIRV